MIFLLARTSRSLACLQPHSPYLHTSEHRNPIRPSSNPMFATPSRHSYPRSSNNLPHPPSSTSLYRVLVASSLSSLLHSPFTLPRFTVTILCSPPLASKSKHLSSAKCTPTKQPPHATMMLLLRVFLLLAAAPLAATEFPFNPFKMMPAFGAILGLTGGGRRTYPFPAGAACKADLKTQCKSIVRVCETGDEVRVGASTSVLFTTAPSHASCCFPSPYIAPSYDALFRTNRTCCDGKGPLIRIVYIYLRAHAPH